jgi:type IV secretion system protein VirB9
MKPWNWIAVLAVLSSHAYALDVPKSSPNDTRVRYVLYKEDDVVNVSVALGVATRIILGLDETIVESGAGFPSDCDVLSHEWCIKAIKGSRQIYVKPRTGATSNNLELQTTKRDYSFKFTMTKGAERSTDAYYRIVFQYALPLPAGELRLGADAPQDYARFIATDSKEKSSSAPKIESPLVRNADYSRLKGEAKDESIVPAAVFDDGRFTYFKFPKNQEAPVVFFVDENREEVAVKGHSVRLLVDPQNPKSKVENDWWAAHIVAKEFMLRLGSSVVQIRNNAYDAAGVETLNGTTTPKFIRVDK